MNTIIVTTEEALEGIIKKVLRDIELEKSKNIKEPIYSINQAAKLLHLSHSTVKNRIQAGMIKTTLDGRIPESSINRYLQNLAEPP